MAEQLKPCPCGHEAKLIYVRGESYGLHLGEKYTSIKCSCCSFSSNDVEEWNTRADGWISAKNNPPSKSCQVIAEWSNGDIEQSSYITDWGMPHFQRKCGTDENVTGWKGNVGHAINWMPLPSPSAK